jgi:hypothetical protein
LNGPADTSGPIFILETSHRGSPNPE